MEPVVIADLAGRAVGDALEAVFAPFGGVRRTIPAGVTVAVKPNAISFSPKTYTDPAVLEGLLAYLGDHGFYDLQVMENCTGGNFTRLVFAAVGYAEICRRHGARPVYLDEGPTVEVTLRGEDGPTRIPRRLAAIVARRAETFYLSLPKLKTHSMGTVTLGVKNQQAFPVHADRMHRHNAETLHARLASIYDLIRPDFCVIDGTTAVFHGHVPPARYLDQCTDDLGILIGGRDTLAVDTVGAKVLGHDVDGVAHLRIVRDWGLGVGDLAGIDVTGVPLSRFTRRYPHELLGRFHPDVRIVEGRKKACTEGCKGNSLCIQEMLANDYPARGGWTLVFGKGVEDGQLADLPGDMLVIGPCAVAELRDRLRQRYPRRKLYFVDACNDLMNNVRYQVRLSGLSPVRMAPLNPVRAAWLLALARLKKTTARVPPLVG